MRSRLVGIGLVAAAPATTLVLLVVTGGLAVPLPGLPDPGPLTRYGLPGVQGLRDLAATATVGMLFLAVTCVAPDDGDEGRRMPRAVRRLLDAGGRVALLWSGLALTHLVLTFSDAAGSPLGSAGFLDQVVFFATEYELGRYSVWTAGLALLTSLLVLAAASTRTAGAATALAVAALWPMALAAHGAGQLRHDWAVDAQAVHLVAVSVWAGGLVGLLVVRRSLGSGFVPTVRRYSTVAGWCLLLVGLAGLAGAYVRLGTPGALVSDYGALLGLKTVLALGLGLAGLWHRRRMLGLVEPGTRGPFARMVAVEVLVMAAAAGTAVALNRTPPGALDEGPSPTAAEDLLGYRMPDALEAVDWFTAWRVDALWLPIALLAVVLYATAVVRLVRRGDRWPVHRLVTWLLGWGMFVWATSGAPGTYGRLLFSMHMVQHMTIATAVPVLLVIGAPVTLALRALRRRDDGTLGPREWLLAVVHSPPARLLAHPLVAGASFVVSLVVFYYSRLFPLALESHTGHVLMVAHFLVAGYFFAGCLVGTDPGLRQPTYPLRVLMVMVVFGFHALFSVSLMASSRILAEDWFVSVRPDWAETMARDQYVGASLGWALGDYPLALLAGLLVVSWFRADRRESRRFDRQEQARDGAGLAAYNAYLSDLAAHGRRRDTSAVDGGEREPEQR